MKTVLRFSRRQYTAMEEITFKVQGSAPAPYVVHFSKTGNNLTAHCTCPAGARGLYCKHRMRILEGSVEGIVSGNDNAVPQIVSWLAGSDVEGAMAEVVAAHEKFEAAKQKLATALSN